MKRIIKTSLTSLVIAAAITATQSFAGVITQTPMPTPVPEYFNGWYVGLGGGLVKPNAKVNYDYWADISISGQSSLGELSKTFESRDSGKFGIGGNIFAGFGKTFDSKYLGFEVFGNLYDPNMKTYSKLDLIIPSFSADFDIIFKTKINNDYSYGILLRGGYLISPKTMFYILFGLDQSKFKVKSSAIFNGFDSLGIPPVINDILTTTDKFHKTKTGCLPGIGLETVLNDQFTLRMQYIYTFYSSFKHTVEDIVLVSSLSSYDVDKKYTTKVDPSRGVFSLMLSWYLA